MLRAASYFGAACCDGAKDHTDIVHMHISGEISLAYVQKHPIRHDWVD